MLTDLDSEGWRKAATQHQLYVSVLWNDSCPSCRAITSRNDNNKRNKNKVQKTCFVTVHFYSHCCHCHSSSSLLWVNLLVSCKCGCAVSALWLVRRSLLWPLIGAAGSSSSTPVPPSLQPTPFKPAEALVRSGWAVFVLLQTCAKSSPNTTITFFSCFFFEHTYSSDCFSDWSALIFNCHPVSSHTPTGRASNWAIYRVLVDILNCTFTVVSYLLIFVF